jgi:hypothetical protein
MATSEETQHLAAGEQNPDFIATKKYKHMLLTGIQKFNASANKVRTSKPNLNISGNEIFGGQWLC